MCFVMSEEEQKRTTLTVTSVEDLARVEAYVRGLNPACWVCSAREWELVENEDNFGIITPGFVRTTSKASEYGAPMVAMICTRCANVWLTGIYAVLMILEDRDIAGKELK